MNGKIVLKRLIVFKDQTGKPYFALPKGTVIEFTAKGFDWWITKYGGIWFDEAEEVA